MHPDWRKALGVLAATLAGSAMIIGQAGAALTLSAFSVTPSTLQAGGHPSLRLSVAFAEPSTGVKGVAMHLPAGLSADSGAIPYCARSRLVRNLCWPKSKAGSLTVTAVAYGIELPVTRNIYNVRPIGTERLRLGVPIIGSYSSPGIAAELPVTERPGDRGLDLAVSGLPSEVGGYPVRLKSVTVSIRGTGAHQGQGEGAPEGVPDQPAVVQPRGVRARGDATGRTDDSPDELVVLHSDGLHARPVGRLSCR